MEVGGRLCDRGGFLSLQALKSYGAGIIVTKQVGGWSKVKKIELWLWLEHEGKSLNCVFTYPPAPPSQAYFHCIDRCALIRASRPHHGIFCIRANLSSLLRRAGSPAERLEV